MSNFESLPNEHVFAVVYKPNPRVIDMRGTWAALLAEKLDLPNWSVGTNRADVFKEDESRRVFIGFREFGVQLRDTFTRNFFPEFAGKFLSCLAALDEFQAPLEVQRLGVRSRFCTPYIKGFAALASAVQETYVTLQPSALKVLGESLKVTDVGAPFHFKDKLGAFKTHLGPMETEQLKQFFDFAKSTDLPTAGLYFDIDYFQNPKTPLKIGSIADQVSQFAVEAWDKHLRIRKLIVGV